MFTPLLPVVAPSRGILKNCKLLLTRVASHLKKCSRRKTSTQKGVDLPAVDKSTPGADPKPERHNPQESSQSTGDHQEAEEVQARPPVKQTAPILFGPISPELVCSLPTMFPPSPSCRRAQLGSARAAQAVLTSADAQRVTVTAGNPPAMSSPSSLNYQMQPVTNTSIPSPSTATKSLPNIPECCC